MQRQHSVHKISSELDKPRKFQEAKEKCGLEEIPGQ